MRLEKAAVTITRKITVFLYQTAECDDEEREKSIRISAVEIPFKARLKRQCL